MTSNSEMNSGEKNNRVEGNVRKEMKPKKKENRENGFAKQKVLAFVLSQSRIHHLRDS